MPLSLIQEIAISIIPILFAITLHEVAHGWVANQLGDPTARLLGRLSINPIKHIDLVGTILVPALLITLGGFIFGWAKPVPVAWKNLKNPRRDMALVAAAGPISNFIMACIWALLFNWALHSQPAPINFAFALLVMSKVGVVINIVLMVLNFLPFPPLDGSRIFGSFLPRKLAYYYDRIEPYGFFILLILMTTGVLGMIMDPFIQFFVAQLI